MDFTFTIYKHLLLTLQMQDFLFITVSELFEKVYGSIYHSPDIYQNKFIILRHDVEARYENALRMALIEHDLGISASYYFRFSNKFSNEVLIGEVASLGHEIGYHYDDLSACRGNHEKAMERFQANLAYLRQFAPVTTITMEGAPLSRFDNRDLWKSYDYRKLGIVAEPYFDMGFNKIFYLTDTGRRWDGHLYNVRDKATADNPITNPEFLRLRFHSTADIIQAVGDGNFPKQAMLNFHPQRWNSNPLPWLKELVWQNIKNQVKRVIVKMR